MGSAQCVGYAPNTFSQDDDTVSIVIDQHGDPEEQVQDAIRFCPTQSISLVEIPET
jgi:ferredoxin